MQTNFNKKILVNIIIGLLILSGCFLATQLTAIRLHCDPALGKPLIGWLQLYNPLSFFIWVYQFGDLPELELAFSLGWDCLITVTTILLLFGLYRYITFQIQRQRATSQGSAHFASWREVKKSGLLEEGSQNAVYVGGYNRHNKIYPLCDSSPTHIFVYAPTRSGKGVGLIVPTLLSYGSSVIVSDFKLENWQLTAGYRKALGQLVFKFDPTCTDGTAASFNPLMEIRKGELEVRDVQLIADMLVDPTGKNHEDHWGNAANALLVSVILHVLYAENDKTLAGVRNFLSDPTRSLEDTLYRMLTTIHDPNKKYKWFDQATQQPTYTHPIVAFGAREMLNKDEPERTSIVSAALTFLKLYRDPIVANNTRQHHFTIHDLVYHKQPVSLYLGIPPADINRTMPLMRLILQMILSRLTESLDVTQDYSSRRQLLLMLDEFPQFGRLPFFEKSLAYSAGYSIRTYLISQDMQQIYKEYGHDQSIVSNCGIRIAYTPNTLETAKHLSENLGVATLKLAQVSYSGKRSDLSLSNISVNSQEVKRLLLTPDELLRLDENAMLIFKNGVAPIFGNKLYYYRDPEFNKRTQMAAPKKSNVIKMKNVWLENHIKEESLEATEKQQAVFMTQESTTEKNITGNSGITKSKKKLASKSLPVQFINCLRQKIFNNEITFNQKDSFVHLVESGVLVVIPLAIDYFLKTADLKVSDKETSETLIKKFSRASILNKPKLYYYGEWESKNCIEGWVIPAAKIFSNPFPPINAGLHPDVINDPYANFI